MDPTAIFWFIYSFYLATFIWNFYLTLRQYNVYRKTETRPEKVSGIISNEDFVKARNYNLDKMHFGFYEIAFGKTLSTVILFCNLIPWLWSICGRYGQVIWPRSGEIFQSVLFIVSSSIFETVIELPFSYYETFYVEQKHGFNKELMMFIYPEFIAPLFDKYTPLPESELKTKIEALANKVEFPLKKLYVVEGSKRSSHSNAYMYGFWKNKRIVLYDTLLSEEMNKRMKQDDQKKTEMKTTPKNEKDTEVTNSETAEGETNSTSDNTLEGEPTSKTTEEKVPATGTGDEQPKRSLGMADDEIVAVLGHELGHWREYHSMWLLISTELNMLTLLFVFGFLYREPNLYLAFGFPLSAQQPALIGILLVSQYVFAPYNELMSVIMSFMTRRFEFGADAFAARLGFVSQLSTGLVKLGKDNLSLPINDWLYSACNHSHPPILERLEALKKFK
uniref:CAAX prenyl protease n=2 Tax=Meloidogyne TaxID=189290 RepID=A0A915LJ60_MELJA